MELDESPSLPELQQQQGAAVALQQQRTAAGRRRCSVFAKAYLELGREKQQQKQQQQLNKKRRKTKTTRNDECEEEEEGGIGVTAGPSDDELQQDENGLTTSLNGRNSGTGTHLNSTSAAEEELLNNDSDFDTDLDDTDIPETPFDLFGTRTYLRSCRKLRLTPVSRIVLDLKTSAIALRHRGLDDGHMLAFAHALLDNTTVTELYIEDSPLTTKSVTYLCLSLQENLNIHTLSLSNTKLSIESVKLICDLLLQNVVIKRINLSGNALTDNATDLIGKVIGWRILGQIRSWLPFSLDIDFGPPSNEEINENHSLIDVNLSHNQFTDGACDSLGKGIGENESILTLDLSWNQIRSHGAQTLCRKLEKGCVIRQLNLSMNGLGEVGAKAVGDLLKVNGTIEDLDLTSSRINDRGVIALTNGLIVNNTLKHLRISENPMTSVGVYGLLIGLKRSLSESSRLTVVDARSVRIHKEVVDLYEDLKKQKADFLLLHGDILSTKSSVIDDKLNH